jgi:hypothetical protein
MHWPLAPTAWIAVGILLFNLPSAIVAQTAVNVIDISGDGQTCPEGTQPSAAYNGICSYGSYISNRKTVGKCCFHPTQLLFLQSRTGGEKHLNATYNIDSQWCCSAGEEGTALRNSMCMYGSNSLIVQADIVTKCCWNTTAGDFSVYMTGMQPLSTWPKNYVTFSGQKTSGSCKLGYNIIGKNIKIYGDRLELDVATSIGCDDSIENRVTTMVVYFRKDYIAKQTQRYIGQSRVGQIRVPFPLVDTNILVKINLDYLITISGSLRITGLSIPTTETVDFMVTGDDSNVKEALSLRIIC